MRFAEQRDINPANLEAIEHVIGQGVSGTYQGAPIRIGSFDYCEALIPVCFRAHTKTIVSAIRDGGSMPVVIAHHDSALVLALADEPRPGARVRPDRLKQAGVEQVAMLTGDHPATAHRIAEELGIELVESQLMPEQKVEHIERLRDQRASAGALAVIGDGVNDAPAMAVADIGLAMGGVGADAALETADVILLHDDLDRVPWSFTLARRVRAIMAANLIFATAVIAVLGVCAALGAIPLYLGVLGHEGSTLIVVANSLRLLAHRDPPKSA
jgi:Cd2+/Zn2+-exporting ATPase